MMGENQRMPRLFASSGTPVAEGKGVSHGVQTPMGEVRFTASDDGREIATGHPERWRVGDNAWLERWESSGLELERLTCKIAPELPPGMRVDGCWGVMWRFLADQEIARFRWVPSAPLGCVSRRLPANKRTSLARRRSGRAPPRARPCHRACR